MLLAEGRSLVSPSTVILRRNALERIGGFQYVPGLPLTDYQTFIELSLVGTFYYLPQTTGFRRRHENSITVNHARTIHEKVSEFALLFLTRHRDQIALTVTELTALQENWRRSQDKLHFTEGRTLLLRKMWPDARAHFRLAAQSHSPGVRLAAAAGLLLSCLHTNIEPLMRLGGRAELRASASKLGTGSQAEQS
jgi:hypothetical protein